MSFTPATDDVEVFLRDLQECAKQLNYDDQVVITTIRAAMPQEVYGALYKMNELSEVIDFCKNYYAKSPKERLKAQSTANWMQVHSRKYKMKALLTSPRC